MSVPAQNGPTWRKEPLTHTSLSPASMSAYNVRPKSVISSPLSPQPLGHARHQSFSPLGSVLPTRSDSTRARSNSHRTSTPSTGTFAPQFIKSAEIQNGLEAVRGIEGENDFSGKRYVWLKDADTAFVKAWVVEELPGNGLVVECEDGEASTQTCNRSDCKLTFPATTSPRR